jgi:hypothetical protein
MLLNGQNPRRWPGLRRRSRRNKLDWGGRCTVDPRGSFARLHRQFSFCRITRYLFNLIGNLASYNACINDFRRRNGMPMTAAPHSSQHAGSGTAATAATAGDVPN